MPGAGKGIVAVARGLGYVACSRDAAGMGELIAALEREVATVAAS